MGYFGNIFNKVGIYMRNFYEVGKKDLCQHVAKLRKLQYDAYIQAGFNEATALYFIVNGVH